MDRSDNVTRLIISEAYRRAFVSYGYLALQPLKVYHSWFHF